MGSHNPAISEWRGRNQTCISSSIFFHRCLLSLTLTYSWRTIITTTTCLFPLEGRSQKTLSVNSQQQIKWFCYELPLPNSTTAPPAHQELGHSDPSHLANERWAVRGQLWAPGWLCFRAGLAVSCGQIPVTSTASHLSRFITLLKSEMNPNQTRKKINYFCHETFSLSTESFFKHILLSLKSNNLSATFDCFTALYSLW